MLWVASVALCIAGFALMITTLGLFRGLPGLAVFNFWIELFGEEGVKRILMIGILLLVLGLLGIVVTLVDGCVVSPQGCLAG